MLRLRARAWPTGEAEVLLRLEAEGAETRVVIEEDAVSGPGSRWFPRSCARRGSAWRNVEALRRLAYLAERRTS